VDGALSSGEHSLLMEARTLVEAVLVRSPANERLLISRSHILAALEAPKTAIPELEAYCQTKEGSSSVVALVTLADLYRLAGDAEQAGQWIERAERLDSSSQAVVHARFLWLVSQKRFEELANISSAYLSAKEQDSATVLQAASTLLSLDSMDLKKEGVKLFEHAATLAPTSMNARLALASSLYQTGNAERAQEIYEELLEQNAKDVRALNDLAWILQEHDQRYADALELANKGLRLAPGHLNLLDTRGTILSQMPDRLADARRDFEELVRLSSSDIRRQAKALLQLGHVCAKLGDLTQAKRHLESAMDIDNKNHVFTSNEQSEISELSSTWRKD
jgi:tetratricopeptide (TPR) repeat protein